jgi:hypothetical protein
VHGDPNIYVDNNRQKIPIKFAIKAFFKTSARFFSKPKRKIAKLDIIGKTIVPRNRMAQTSFRKLSPVSTNLRPDNSMHIKATI